MVKGASIARGHWFKVVGMLQQTWALVEPGTSGEVTIVFLDDEGTVFDELVEPSSLVARQLLQLNGFRRWEDDTEAQKFIRPPSPPYARTMQPTKRVYSSGEWKRC